MSIKLSMQDLISLEENQCLWNITFLEYPLWIHFREDLIANGIKADRKIAIPAIKHIISSTFQTLKFIIYTQHTRPTTYFLMERTELLESFKQEIATNKVLFLNHEQEHLYHDSYIRADFLNAIRFICRRITYILFYFYYLKAYSYFQNTPLKETEIKQNIKNSMGDAFFLKLLSKIFRRDYPKYYSGCIIPIGEKFINRLNTFEVQHGIIQPSHVGYIGLPMVKNALLLYDKRYEVLLREHNYQGTLFINPYKKKFLETKSTRYFPIVIYTQPLQEMQEALINFLTENKNHKNIYIQKHPKDYALYPIEHIHIVNSTMPCEVGSPIFYTSSVIENYTLSNRTCYIWLVSTLIDVHKILNIFLIGSSSKFIEDTSLKQLMASIQISKQQETLS